MADGKENIQGESQGEEDVDEDEGMISLDDIDSIIAESDPEFDESLNDLVAEDVVEAEEDETSSDEQQLESEVVRVKLADRFPKLFKFVIIPIKVAISHPVQLIVLIFTKIKPLVGKALHALVKFIKNFKAHSAIFFKEKLPSFGKAILNALRGVSGFFKDLTASFKSLSLLKKAAVVWFFILLGFTGWSLRQTLNGLWIPFLKSEIVYDLSKMASESDSIDSNEDWVLIHEAFPQPEYSVLLEKYVVNLKRVGRGNPMVAVQLYLTLDAQEAAIELKDREREVLDLVQRITEDFTYDEINDQAGIYRFKAMIKNEINSLLNTGRVKNVLIKHLIPKHP